MAEHNELGHTGEEAAARYLMFHDYSIRSMNWRTGHKEIDIVAEKRGLLVFVEVKSRRDEAYGLPEDAVDEEKIHNLVSAADTYMRYYELDMPVRFDIITVTGLSKPFHIRHIKNAFSSPLYGSGQPFTSQL